MSEAIQSKDEKEYALRQCCGRLLRHTWQIEAAGSMIRDITGTDLEGRDETETVLCNGLLAANSFMMTDAERLMDLLALPVPDWDAIKKNQPGGRDLASALE